MMTIFYIVFLAAALGLALYFCILFMKADKITLELQRNLTQSDRDKEALEQGTFELQDSYEQDALDLKDMIKHQAEIIKGLRGFIGDYAVVEYVLARMLRIASKFVYDCPVILTPSLLDGDFKFVMDSTPSALSVLENRDALIRVCRIFRAYNDPIIINHIEDLGNDDLEFANIVINIPAFNEIVEVPS